MPQESLGRVLWSAPAAALGARAGCSATPSAASPKIWAAFGFESLGSFSAPFRRETGRSPSAWRREIRKIGGAAAAPRALGWRP